MTDEMKKQLENIGTQGLTQLVDWTKQAGAFVKEQAPILAQEILKMGIIDAITAIVSFALLIIGGIFVAGHYVNKFTELKKENPSEDWEFGIVISTICKLAPIIGGIIGIVYNSYYIFYINYCPRLYIIEEISKLVK